MVATTVAGRDVDPLRATLAGLGASFVGIGLARCVGKSARPVMPLRYDI